MNDLSIPLLIVLFMLIFSPDGLGIKIGKFMNAYEQTRGN